MQSFRRILKSQEKEKSSKSRIKQVAAASLQKSMNSKKEK